MNRLRTHFADQQAQKGLKRLQRAIVRDYRDDIVELIVEDGATLSEVASAVRAQGEPVLDHGFKAEILKQIGTVKSVRAGRAKEAAWLSASAQLGPQSAPDTSSASPITSQTDIDENFADDDEDTFAARRSRGRRLS